MPPDNFFAGRSEKGASPVLSRSSEISPVPFGAGLSEQAAKKLDILADAEVRIEVLAQSLRHVGDARADRGPMRWILHVAIEHEDVSGLDLPRAGNDAQQRRLSDPVGTDEPDHATGRKLERHRVEGDHGAVSLRDIFDAATERRAPDHCAAFPCNWGGQATAGSSFR